MQLRNINTVLYTTLLSSSLLFSSCTKKMDSLFQNPDAFSTVEIEYLLPTAVLNTVKVEYTDVYNYTINKMGPMTQVLANVNDPVSGQWYNVTSDLGFWTRYYTTKMNNLKGIEQIYDQLPADKKKGYDVYMPIVKILEAYATAQATDLYDDMPYENAFGGINSMFGGTANYTPAYDAQNKIYTAVLDDLKKAAADLTGITLEPTVYAAHKSLPTQDILFQGNLSKWIKLANSLRLRYAMRISDADAARSKAEIEDLVNSGAPMITANAENGSIAVGSNINVTGGSGSTYIRAFFELSANVFAPQMMVDSMKAATDPRLLVMFVCQGAPSTFENYKGMPAAFDDRAAVNNASISKVDSVLIVQNSNLPAGIVIDAADVNFLLSEAYFKGLTPGGADNAKAQEFYETGMRKSVENYYNLYIGSSQASRRRFTSQPSTAAVDAMVTSTTYMFNTADFLDRLAYQKWVNSNYLQMFETYSEYRRLDKPTLPADIYQGQSVSRIPARFLYPGVEASTNGANFSSVSAKNNDQTKVWWDKN